MTLLSLGKHGYLELCKDRKQRFNELKQNLETLAKKYNCKLLETKGNPISLALCFDGLSVDQPTKLGSMLYTRGISGTRVVAPGPTKTVDGYEFKSKFITE